LTPCETAGLVGWLRAEHPPSAKARPESEFRQCIATLADSGSFR
jgi:hypothetical protein